MFGIILAMCVLGSVLVFLITKKIYSYYLPFPVEEKSKSIIDYSIYMPTIEEFKEAEEEQKPLYSFSIRVNPSDLKWEVIDGCVIRGEWIKSEDFENKVKYTVTKVFERFYSDSVIYTDKGWKSKYQ